MKKISSLLLLSIWTFSILMAQNSNFPKFPQGRINAFTTNPALKGSATNTFVAKPQSNSSAFQALQKIEAVKHTDWNSMAHGSSHTVRTPLDTMYVGLVPHDTVVITGVFNHDGPIWVFNDGVLIFYNATVTNTNGDLIVFQHGTVLSDSSSLTFPQDYFYQRSLLIVQNAIGYFVNTSFNYSGMQHNLVVGDVAQAGFENVHQNDWTTAGIYGSGTIYMHGVNLSGEYILTDTATAYYNHADSLLLWHKLPSSSVLNYSFPNGSTVYNYQFNNTMPGVSGINYNVGADSCNTVWWGLMPTNGSDVTVNNSNIRAIGCWFEHGDTATVNGLYDNTTYANTVVPFTDRNMHLINTYVMTWSLYVFDSSKINIYNSTVGEVGTQQEAQIISQSFILDGTGGYFWATDSSTIFASDVTVLSTARSEKKGIFVLSYSTLPYSVPTAISESIFFSVQNNLPADPIPFDAGTMWMQNIESPSIAHADSIIPVQGSEWIDQGPAGGRLFYSKYSLYYQLYGAGSWTPIVTDSALEIRHNNLGNWNTNGLTAGTYLLRLLVRDTYGDSVECYKVVTVLPGVATGIQDNNLLAMVIFPNPATSNLNILFAETMAHAEIRVLNMLGQEVLKENCSGLTASINLNSLENGSYLIETRVDDKINRQRFVKK